MLSTVVEYLCPDCGTLLMHVNPVTLDSMKDVHSQLCAIKRQRSMAALSVKSTATQKPPLFLEHSQHPPLLVLSIFL
jgi:hypothetical protein